MLSWPAGKRATDGVWAPAWYDQVERSTGFKTTGQSHARFVRRATPDLDAAKPYSNEQLATGRRRLRLFATLL